MVANYTPRKTAREIPRPRNRNRMRMRSQSKRRMTAMKIATGIFPDVSLLLTLLTLLLALQTGALWKISLLNYKACHVRARVREKRRARQQSQWRRKTLRLMKINSAKRQLRHSQRVLPQFDVPLSLSLCSHTKWRTSAEREREKERESVRHSRSSFAARVGVVDKAGSTNQSASLAEPVWQVGLVLCNRNRLRRTRS